MMSNVWMYDGCLSADDASLTLDTDGPSFVAEGKVGRYRDRFEFTSDSARVFTSSYQGDDGAWHTFMTTRYRRAGAT